MQSLTKYKNPDLSLLMSATEKSAFSGGMIPAINRSRKGSAIRFIKCKAEGERIAGQIVSTDSEKRRLLIGQKIVLIGRSFGATGQMPSDIMSALVSFVEQSFNYLSIEEIGIAFNLAASGQIEVDVSLYGKPINIDWLSRILRAYTKKRRNAVAIISKTEDEFHKIMNFDEAAERLKRTQSHKEIINDIVRAYLEYKEGTAPNLFVYHFAFLEKIGAIEISKEDKKRAFQQAKEKIIRELQSEKEGQTNIIDRQRTDKKIADLLSGQDTKNGRQARFAINSLIQNEFRLLSNSFEPPEGLEDDLQKRYFKVKDQLTAVRYLVRLTSKKGSERTTKPISRDEMKELFSTLPETISGVKISIV